MHHRKKVHIFCIKLWFKEIVSLSTKCSVDKRRYFAPLFIFVLSTGKPLILGDLNFHVDEPHKDLEAARLLELLNVHNLKQQVTVLTHRSKHTLDSVIYRSNRSFNIPPPPGHTPSIWHLCRPGEEGIWLSESSRGWGIWTAPSISCKIFGVASYGGRGVRGFSWKRLCLCSQLVTRFVPYLKVFKFWYF